MRNLKITIQQINTLIWIYSVIFVILSFCDMKTFGISLLIMMAAMSCVVIAKITLEDRQYALINKKHDELIDFLVKEFEEKQSYKNSKSSEPSSDFCSGLEMP